VNDRPAAEGGGMGTHRRRPDDRTKWVFDRIAATDAHRKHTAHHPWRGVIPYVMTASVVTVGSAVRLLRKKTHSGPKL
jgi:hypothetical protein